MHKSRLCSFPGNFALQGKKGLDSAFESKMNICKRGRMIRFKSFLFLLLKGFLLNKEKKPQSCSARCCTGSLCCKVNTEQAPRLPEGGRRKEKQSGSSLVAIPFAELLWALGPRPLSGHPHPHCPFHLDWVQSIPSWCPGNIIPHPHSFPAKEKWGTEISQHYGKRVKLL